jgi:hypothetical protein
MLKSLPQSKLGLWCLLAYPCLLMEGLGLEVYIPKAVVPVGVFQTEDLARLCRLTPAPTDKYPGLQPRNRDLDSLYSQVGGGL